MIDQYVHVLDLPSVQLFGQRILLDSLGHLLLMAVTFWIILMAIQNVIEEFYFF